MKKKPTTPTPVPAGWPMLTLQLTRSQIKQLREFMAQQRKTDVYLCGTYALFAQPMVDDRRETNGQMRVAMLSPFVAEAVRVGLVWAAVRWELEHKDRKP